MALISVKCPTCGESFQADNSREFVFCSYCGAKVELSLSESESEKDLMDSVPDPAVEEALIMGKTSLKATDSREVKYITREEFERKKRFERRCNEVIAFFSDQLSKPDKKSVNSRAFFNEHMTEWQEALYRVQKELKEAEISQF